MNIAYLDPPYSRYFHRLCAHLNERTGGSTVALLSSPAYRLYAHGDPTEVWKPGELPVPCRVPPAFERAEWAQSDPERFGRVLAHAVEWFTARFRERRIDACFLFSDARPFSLAAHIAAQSMGLPCLFFERGAFRLRTASLSTQGLNARFSIDAARRCDGVAGLAETGLPAQRAIEPWLRLRFVLFMAANALACALQPGREPMQHKRYHVFNYLRIALRQFLVERGNADAHREPLPDLPGVPTVILPLQLKTDSQFVMHSPFRHNQDLLDFVVAHVRAELPDAQVLVKKHPMDVRSYRLPPGARWVSGNLARFYEHARMLVCLNSTVGFEAACHGKVVLCFGASFYTDHPHIVRVSLADFAARLKSAAARQDDIPAGKALRDAVLRYYQSPGDVWAYADDDLQATAEIVIQHVQDVGMKRPRNRPSRVPVSGASGDRADASSPVAG
jgi:capsular polysaccharide export protein